MKKLKTLQLPNARASFEREIVSVNEALSNFATGRQENTQTSCVYVPCSDDILICVPGEDAEETLEYHFRANDATSPPPVYGLFWVGILPNQGGSPGQGAEGSSYYYFKSSSPTAWAGTYAIGEQVDLHITGYVSSPDSTRGLKIGFFDSRSVIGGTAEPAFLISETTLKIGPASTWTAFDVSVTTPIGTTCFALGKIGSSVSFDEIRLLSVSSPSGPVCTVYGQDGAETILSGSNVPASVITASLTESGSFAAFELPTEASDVGGVWLDQLPTDLWTFDSENSTIILPEAVLADTHILVRYII